MVNILKKRNKITGVYRILFEKGIIFNIHWLKSKCSVVCLKYFTSNPKTPKSH